MARTPVKTADFTGSNGTNIEDYTGGSTDWSQKSSGQGAGYIGINSNKLTTFFSDGSPFVYREDIGTYSGDQYASAALSGFANDSGSLGVAVRISSDTGANADWYAVRVFLTTDEYELVKCVNGSISSLAGPTSQSFSDGDTVELEALTEGSDCRLLAYRNGSQLVSYLDTSSPLTGGKPGVYFRDAGNSYLAFIDDWVGGDATAAGGDEEDALSGSAVTGGHGTASPVFTIGL